MWSRTFSSPLTKHISIINENNDSERMKWTAVWKVNREENYKFGISVSAFHIKFVEFSKYSLLYQNVDIFCYIYSIQKAIRMSSMCSIDTTMELYYMQVFLCWNIFLLLFTVSCTRSCIQQQNNAHFTGFVLWFLFSEKNGKKSDSICVFVVVSMPCKTKHSLLAQRLLNMNACEWNEFEFVSPCFRNWYSILSQFSRYRRAMQHHGKCPNVKFVEWKKMPKYQYWKQCKRLNKKKCKEKRKVCNW